MSYLFQTPSYNPTTLMWKESVITETQTYLQKVHELIRALPANAPWTSAHVKETIWNYVNLVGKGHVLWPFRIALSGAERSPDPFTLAELLGRTETEARVAAAITALEKLGQQKAASN
jgi:glutamyl/glutaminyl-tRNA synthetase